MPVFRHSLLLLTLDYLVSAGVIAIYSYAISSATRSLRSLRSTPDAPLKRPVTVIVAAHNERERIGGLIDSLSSSPVRPGLVVLVDDRSHDGTADVAMRAPGGIDLVVRRVDKVPRGWAPKANALMAGALSAPASSSALFLDVDVRGELGRLISVSSSLLPGWLAAFEPSFVCRAYFCRAVQPFFTAALHGFFGFNRALDPDDPHSLIYGCCWAIDPYTFWELGGLSRVRSSLLEDREFAKYAKSRGVRLIAYDARPHLRVESWASPREFLELIKRISYGTSRSMRPTVFVLSSIGLSILLLWPLTWLPLLAMGAYAYAIGPLLSYVSQASLALLGQRAEGLRGPWFLLSPLPAALLLAGFILSRTSPIAWRDQVIDPAAI
ncbi:MAG: glycosyltransferase [Acidilobus sp.]